MLRTFNRRSQFPERKRSFYDSILLLSRKLSFRRKLSFSGKLPSRYYQRRGAVQIKSFGADYTIKNGNWVLWVDTLSEEEMSEIKEAFAMHDKHKNGSVKLKELGGILRTLGQMPTEDKLTDFFLEADADNSGTIEYPEFVTLMAKRRSDPEEDMKLAFEAFDENGDRLISREELMNFVSSVGEVLHEEEFEEMMEKIDCDGDGFIDYEEFVYMMARGHIE